MTVSTADLREEYTATAGQTAFTFDFRVFSNTDVKVYQTPAGVDFDDATYLITAYTMTPNADQDANQGGTVTLNSGATLGDRITIISNVSETRATDYKDGGVFDPDLVDNDMDRSLSIAKQAKEAIRLAPRFNESAHGVSGIQLPELTPNTIWRVNGEGSAIEAVTLGDGVVSNGIPLANYAALRAYDSSYLADGQIITLSDNGGYFVVKSGAVSDDGFSLIVFTDNSSRYAQRVEPAYSNSLSLKQVIDYNEDSRQSLIEGSGQTFSASNTDQVHKAVANYSVVNFEAGDSGGANTVVLTLGSGRETLSSLTQCAFVFEVNTTNTGATTVDSSLILGQSAGTTIDDLRDVNDAALTGGELVAGMMAHIAFNATTGRWQLLNSAGTIVQVVNVQDGAVATGTTSMVFDDTIPQNTEGTEFMTLAITPTSATNKLIIDVVIGCWSLSTTTVGGVALFQDSTANALAGVPIQVAGANSGYTPLYFRHYMTAGTTSSTTFKVRAGGQSSNTFTFNGTVGARRYGGVIPSSITITEISA